MTKISEFSACLVHKCSDAYNPVRTPFLILVYHHVGLDNLGDVYDGDATGLNGMGRVMPMDLRLSNTD